MPARTKLSAIIITYNEEKKIERCLRSVDWVDEIVVVDSHSTDRTVELCRRYTDKVYLHPWPNSYSEQRNIATRRTTNEWVLSLDADEVVTKALRDEIIEMLKEDPNVDVFGIPRREYFAGKWIKAGNWYPQHKVILYRKSRGEWVNPIHERFETSGKKGFLKNPILHDGYGDFKLFMDKFNQYSSVEAKRDYEHNHRFSLLKMIFKPLERFYGRFIRHRGYKDGIHGFYMAAIIAINYFLRELKIYEHWYRERNKESWDAVYRETAAGSDQDASREEVVS